MELRSNNMPVSSLTFQQYNHNADYVEFIFKPTKAYDFTGSIVELLVDLNDGRYQIISSAVSNDISFEQSDDIITVKWVVKGSITLKEGTYRLQVTLIDPTLNTNPTKDKLLAYSKTLNFTVLESLNFGDIEVATNGNILIDMMAKIKEFEEELEEAKKMNRGYSAYEIWLQEGNVGSVQDYLNSIKGEKGDKGDKGDQGDQGVQGEKGDKGDPGDSAYQVWLDNGNSGSIDDYLNSIKGEKGDKGDPGGVTLDTLQLYQTKEDQSLDTYNKSIVGAINEVKNEIGNISVDNIDLSNYYNKPEVNNLLNSKQNSTDDSLSTTSKNVTGAINEINDVTRSNMGNIQTSLDGMTSTLSSIYNTVSNISANTQGIVKSVQRGKYSLSVNQDLNGSYGTITITDVNPYKSLVIMEGHTPFSTYGDYVSTIQPYIESFDGYRLTFYYYTPFAPNSPTTMYISWQVIEFY